MSEQPDGRRDVHISTDQDTVREWADTHSAAPVRDSEGHLRIVSEQDTGDSHERLEWSDFFTELEENDDVVVYRGEEAPEPFEVTSRDEAIAGIDLDQEEVERRLIEGEVVRSEVTETTVVEQVIVEQATIESELVDTELVDQHLVDVELLRRECTGCDLVEDAQMDARDLFDQDRYMGVVSGESDETTAGGGALGSEGELPYHAELDVEEAWTVTRELDERLTVESRIVEEDVTGTDSIEDYDIDIEGLHRTIVESGAVSAEKSTDEMISEYEFETEFTEGDTLRTFLDRQRVVEDEVVDRRRLRADITGGEVLGMEIAHTEDVASEPTRSGPDRLDDDYVGMTVVDAAGEEVGMVTDVRDDGEMMYVDPHPGIAEKIRAELNWGDADDNDYPVDREQISRVTDDEIVLKEREELAESKQR